MESHVHANNDKTFTRITTKLLCNQTLPEPVSIVEDVIDELARLQQDGIKRLLFLSIYTSPKRLQIRWWWTYKKTTQRRDTISSTTTIQPVDSQTPLSIYITIDYFESWSVQKLIHYCFQMTDQLCQVNSCVQPSAAGTGQMIVRFPRLQVEKSGTLDQS